MPNFRRRDSDVIAFQYTGDAEKLPYEIIPAVLRSSIDGPCIVKATPRNLECVVGAWIVLDSDGDADVYSPKEFESQFAPVECVPAVDEPSFTVLGRDQLAQATVVHWIERAVAAQVPEDKIRRAQQRWQEIIDWQSDNPDKVKTPD